MNTLSLWKTRASEALYPALNQFHSIGASRLRSVWYTHVEGCLERIVLDFGEVSLAIAVDENDDSIKFHAAETSGLKLTGSEDAAQSEVWRDFVGQQFGWGWITVNQQGYCDGLLLSFAGINPQIVLNVAASSIRAARVTQL